MMVEQEMRSISLPRREPGKFNQVLQSIQKLIDQQMKNPEFARLPRPMILPDEPGSRLIMTATQKQFDVIEQIVSTVTATPEPVERKMRLLRLKDRNAKELIELAEHLFDNEVSPDGTKPQIIADSTGSRLVVIATEEEFKRVEQFALDYNSGRQDLGPHQFKFVDVPIGQVDEVVTAVSKLYQDQLRDNTDRQANAATILADAENNRVIISGPQKEVGRVEGLVRMLGPVKGGGGGQRVTQVVRLKAANAQTVSGLIEKSFNAGGNRSKVSLLVDEASNSLVLTGAEKSVAAAGSVIRELDTDNRGEPLELRILELRAAEAAKVGPLVTELFITLMKDRHGQNFEPSSTIITDEAANRLIITGQPDEIDEIDKLVKQLDSTTRQSAGNRIFKIRAADAKKISEIINRTFVTIDSQGNTRPRLNVAADEISNLLIVAGTPGDIQAVGMIVEQLDVGNPFQPKDLKVIELPHAEGEKLAQLAGRVWGSQMRGVEGNGDVTFIHEPSGKRLIIVSPTELMTRAEQIVNGLLVSPESSSREVAVIELEHGNASELVPVLSSAYEAKVAGLPGIPASILSGANSKQVVVMGTPNQIVEIRGMASELDAPLEVIQKVTESFSLSSAEEVDVVSTMVTQIYVSRHEGSSSDPADAVFLPDATNRRLIVVAKPDHIEEIKQLVKQVQMEGTDRPARRGKSLALAHITGAEVMTVLSQVFSNELAATEPARKLVLTPSPDGSSLFVHAPEDLAKRVESLLVVLDQPGEQVERSVRLIKVGDAAEVARLQPLVEQLYTDHYKGNEQEPADAQVVADPISGNLIVSGRPTHLELIGSLVKDLQGTVTTARQSKSLVLAHIKGAEAMTVLSQVFSVEMATTEPARKLILTPSADGGSLFMDAPDDLAKRVETLLVVLDQPGEKAERSVKLIKVADAAEVARLQPLVEQLYTDRYQGNEQEPADAKIIAEPVTATLVVSGREDHVLAIEMMVAELGLRKPQSRPRVTRVYDLKNAQATTLATTVTRLYEEKLKDSPGASKEQVLVLPDAATNRLIVMAPDNELPVLEELIAQVDQVSLQTAGTRVFKLKANEASQVANLIQSTLVNITAAADPKSNTLIVSGEPEDLQAAAVIIEQLDNLTDKPDRAVQVFTLVNSPADGVALQAKEVYLDQMKGKHDLGDSDAIILPDANGKRLIVTANIRQLPLIEDVITTLDQETASDDRKMVLHSLKNGSATSVMSIIANVFASELERVDAELKLSVTASVDDKSLVVSGQPEDLAKVAKLVATLDTPTAGGEVEVRSYRLPEGDTDDLAEALNNIFERPDGTPGGAIQPKFEADDDTQHLLVAATVGQFERIEKLIKDFQSTAEVTHGIKTFRLAKGKSEEIAKVLREMMDVEETSSNSSSRSSSYYRSRYSRSSSQKPKTKVTSATAINAVIVQGTPSQLAMAEELVQTLEKMDRPEASVMEVVHLEKAEAASVADAVNRALQGGERTRNSSSRSRTSSYRSSSSSENNPEVTVTPEVNSNSLVIVGPAERVKSVLELVRQLDIKGETEGGVDIRIYKLENGEVKSVSQTLEEMIERVLNLMPGSDQDRSRRRFSVRVWGHEDTKTLFVLVPPRQFALVEKLLPMLDQKSEEAMQQGELKFYPVKHASASRLSSVVEEIVDRMAMLNPGSDAERRARQYSVRFWSHTDSNTIIAVVPPDLESMTKELITMLDTSSEVQERLGEIQVFPLKFGEAEDVANMLEEMVERMLGLNPKPGLTSSQMARLVRIWPHEDTNSLFVLVPPDYVDMTKNLVGMLDVKPDDAVQNAEIQLFQLKHSDAEAVGEILESMVERVLTLNAKSKINSRQIENSVEAWPNVETNSLFVLVPKDNLPMVTNLLSMLDAKPERMRRAIHYVMLENADADTVANQIKALFIEEDKTDQPFIEADFFMNSITIIATQEQIAEMSDTIAQLDEAAMDNTLQLRVISSEGVPAKDLAEMLTGLYANLSGVDIRLVEELPEADPQTEPLPKSEQNQEKAVTEKEEVVYIAVDDKINAILASGKANELDRISRLIDDLTITIMDSEAEFRRYELKEADPEGLAKALLDIYARPEKTVIEDGKPTKVPQPPKIVAVPDLRTRSVIVRAEPLDFEFIELLVKELDVIGAPQVDMRFFVLRNARPEDAIGHLQDYFKELKEVRPGEPLEAKADKRTKSVVVVARPEMYKKIEELIERIDVPPEFAEADVLILELRKANAQTLSVILQDMIRPDSKGNLTDEAQAMVEQVQKLNITNIDGQVVQLDLTKPIKVFGESGDGINRLVITSTADNMVALRELVRVMDTVSVIDGVTIRIVTLENAEADNVRDTLSGIFSQSQALGQGPGGKAEPEGSGGRALVNQINIGADDRTNSIIMSGHPDSVDLAERLIVDLDKDVENFVTDVKVYRLKHASTDQIVPMLQSVFKENSSEPSIEGISRQVTRLRLHLEDNGIKVSEVPATRSALTIQGDDSTNTIIVAARSDLLPLIEAVINTLDIPAAGGMESIRIYPLEHANAATIQNVIENLFQGQPRGQVRPEDRPNIVIDSRTNALIIAASKKTLAIVTSLIMRLDQKPENPGILIEVLPLDHNDASQVAGMINDVFSARRRNMLAPGQTAQSQERVNVEADGLTNSLIITASKENVLLIRELVAKLDLEPTAETSQLTIIPLEYVDAQRAGAMLRSLIKQGLYRPGISRSGAARASRESIAISVDHATNTLIISASPENLAVVREVVKQIDTKNYAKAGTLKVYELKYASAPRLARTLDSFFRAKRLAEASLGDADAIVPVTVTHDERTNTLLITGGKESFAIIDELLAKLDADAVMAQNKFDVFPLKNSSAVKVKSTLDRLFTGRTTPPGGQAPQAVTIIADSISNSLVIGAATEDLPMVRDLIERLDEEQASPDINVAVFPLAKANATSVSQIIMSLYRDSDTTTGPSVAVNVDDRINALVVSAGVNDLKRIEELAKQLDTDQLKRVSEIRVFGLKYARATELALLLNTALNTKPENLTSQSADRQELLQFITRTQEENDLVTTGLKEGVLITPDPRTNSLVVSAPVDNMPLIEQLIAKLDSSSPQIAQIKVFQLTNADARQMADVLSTLFRLQSAGGQANTRSIRYTLVMPTDGSAANANGEPTIGTAQENALTVTVDVRTNSLLIGGSEHYVALSSEIIEELDSSPAQERITKVYRLKNSQASDLAEALQAFLDQANQRVTSVLGAEAVGTAQRLLDEEVAIVAEPISNALLVSASPRYFVQVQAMIEELDQPQKQVLIQVLLAEVTLDGSTEWGMQWESDIDLTEKDVPGDTASINSRFGLDPSSALGGLTAVLTGDNWGFILRAMQSDGRLEILSRPQILAVDNMVATIDVGQMVPVVTGSRVTERGDSINTFEYQNVGIQLEVTPRINPDGIVKMDVSPTISSLSSSSVAISAGYEAPIINNRSATTTVSVQDGQTIVIGGLISTEDNERITKIPWLGDIPYIGAVFKKTKKTRVRSELLIILTPHVINTPGEAEKFSRENIDSSNIFEQFQDTETERNRTQRRILDNIKPKAREEKGVEVPQPGKEKEPLPSKI
jgi:type II secretion system protein D